MIITKKDFCNYVEKHYADNTNTTMIDTILEACIQFNVDPEMVEPLVNRSLKDKMKVEFIELNYLKSENTIVA